MVRQPYRVLVLDGCERRSARRATRGGAEPLDEGAHLRQNARAPSLAMEEGEMSAGRYDQLPAGLGGNGWAQLVRSLRLAGCGDVVILALHCHERGCVDASQGHGLVAGIVPPAHKGALLVDVTHGIEKDLRGKVHHGRIEVEEGEACGVRAVVGEQLPEQLASFSHMASQICPQTEQLHGPRIDKTALACMR